MGKIRDFIIDIEKSYEWWIVVKDFDYKTQDKYTFGGDIDYGFGKSGCKDKKIIYLFDIYPRVEDIELAKDDIRFQEVCNFTHNNKTFKGTFIDALEYVKEKFIDR